MKKIAWLTDLHLDFASPESLMKLMVEVKEASPDAVLIGGDTAEFPTILVMEDGRTDAPVVSANQL